MTELRSPLIGRGRELAELRQLLRDARLVTITGAGGCGKTRLARELLASSPPGSASSSVFVELANVEDEGSVVEACRRALGLRERTGTSSRELIQERLRDGETLLVLDNCEHVVKGVARLANEVLDGTAGRLLATSRVPLGLTAERRFVLAPLSLPSGDRVVEVLRSDAARMFLDIASVASPGLELDRATARAVTQICTTLDGLPLALALAAARAGEIALQEIAGGLSGGGALSQQPTDDELRQHRSLRASLEWSFRLLGERDRRVMRRLSVFAGGWSLAAAQAVCAPEDDDGQVREALDRLEAAALIVAQPSTDGPRWTFLSTVSEYAREQLASADESAMLSRRHRRWARNLAARADELLLTPAGRAALDHDASNLVSALERAVPDDADAALAIVAGLARHWILTERLEEGRVACAAALAVASSVRDRGARAMLHCAAALIAVLGERYEQALEQIALGLPLAAGSDPHTEGRCLQWASMAQILTGSDFAGGLARAQRAAELMRGTDDQLGLAMALANIAQAEGLCERFDGVRRAYEEFLETAASDHPRLRAWAEVSIAWSELIVGSPRAALKHAQLALALEGKWPSMTHFVAVCHRLHALVLLGRADEALVEGEQEMERARIAGAGMAVPSISVALAIAYVATGELASAEALASSLLALPQVHTRALMYELLVRIALEQGEHKQAGERLIALEEIARATGSERLVAVCEHLGGRVAAQSGNARKARMLLQSALARQLHAGHERAAAETLEELALTMPLGADSGRRPRLIAAARHAKSQLGCPPSSVGLERIEAARGMFAARFGASAWDEAFSEGEALTLQEAIAYARRAHGRRKRPQSGWEALTQTEEEAAWLAVRGLSNPEIAARLFMSRSTVKVHLSAVYAKLGVANRTQLAALAPRDQHGASSRS